MSVTRGAVRNGTPCRVVFLVQRAESWINVHRLWVLMHQDERFHVDLRVILHDDNQERLKQKRRACIDHLRSVGVPVAERETEGPARLEAGQFDVAIFNAPYDRERVAGFHFDQVARCVDLTVYIPYGLVMGAGRRNRHYQYAQRTQQDSDLVIARSESERNLYEKYCPKGADHVAVTGLPRLDELHNIEHFDADPELRRLVQGRFTVLWNAHFSFGMAFAEGANYSTFDTLAESLFFFASQRPEIALIWRPHPSLFRVLIDEAFLTAEQLDAFRAEVKSAGIILDERADHRHALAVSDMLLTDLGSFLVEYLATKKPLVYLHARGGEGLNEEGLSLVQYLDIARTPADAVQLIDLYASGADPRQKSRELARERFLPMLDGNAAHRVADRILFLMRSQDAVARSATSLLNDLFQKLAELRDLKRVRRKRRTVLGRWVAILRLEVVEWVKRHPAILRTLQQMTSHRRAR